MGPIRIHWIFAAALFATVLSCTTITKNDCDLTDWKAYGARDAADGEILYWYKKREAECKEHGVAPNKAEYLEGYNAGLKKYCTFENGRVLGTRDEDLKDVCPPDLVQAFTEGWRKGQIEFQEAKRLEELKRRQKEIAEKELELAAKEAKMKELAKTLNVMQDQPCKSDNDCIVLGLCAKGHCTQVVRECRSDNDCEARGRCLARKCDFR